MSLLENVRSAFTPAAPATQLRRQRPDDLVDLLHGHAAKRLTELRRKVDDLRALALVPQQEFDTFVRRRAVAKNRKTDIINQRLGRNEETKLVAEVDLELTKLEASISELNLIKAERAQAVGSITNVVQRCETYALDHLLDTPVSLHTIKPVALLKGESELDALSRTRDELEDADAEFADLRSRPLPSDEAKQKVRDHIAGFVEAGRIDVSGVLRRQDGRVLWPTTRNGREDIDIQPLLAFICSEQIIVKLESEVDLLADDARALTDEQYQEKLGELLSRRLQLERNEEEILRLAENKRLPVSRRANADVRAVLGLASSMPAPAQ